VPSVAAISKIDFPHKQPQGFVKEYVRENFGANFPFIDKVMSAFDNAAIGERNLCQPISYYETDHSFRQQNAEYISISLEYSIKAITDCIAKAQLSLDEVTDIIVVSTTGLATPSLDALIINAMHLDPGIGRIPIWGLGCAAGVAAISKANIIARNNPNAVVLIVAVELCTLTFLKDDFSKSNFIALTLFSDGIAAGIIVGDNLSPKKKVNILASKSKLYYDSLDVMGWDFLETGFKVIFSKDIPTIITTHIKDDVIDFLKSHQLELSDIKNFIFHPGGMKVLNAYEKSLGLSNGKLQKTRETMNDYGNMSSPTVLYVFERFLSNGFEDGYGLMLAMGPGFSSEMVLLDMKN
jgi:alkylresorcinol/alkylpyrone synthase